MPVGPALISRPIRATVLLFVVMAAVCAACAPFVPAANLMRFLGGAIAYCLFLAVFVVGLGLAYPSSAVRWWILSGLVPALGLSGFCLLLRSDLVTLFLMVPEAAWGLLAVLLAYLLAGLVVAGSGWVRYARGDRSGSAVEPDVPPECHPQ